MEVFKNKYLQILFDEKNNTCVANWTSDTEHASDNDFKEWNNKLVTAIQEKKVSRLLANTSNYKFIITIELQEWSVSNVFEKFAKAGLKKIALINTSEIISQLSLQQFVDEYKEEKIESQYFTDIDEAKNWLYS